MNLRECLLGITREPVGIEDLLMLRCHLTPWAGDPLTCRWCDTAFKPPRRRWCSDFCSHEALANHVWAFARPTILRRDQWCQACGGWRCRNRHAQVHHRDVNAGGYTTGCQHHLERLELLGHLCHLEAHGRYREKAPPAQLALDLAGAKVAA